jgi:hypothetical protein
MRKSSSTSSSKRRPRAALAAAAALLLLEAGVRVVGPASLMPGLPKGGVGDLFYSDLFRRDRVLRQVADAPGAVLLDGSSNLDRAVDLKVLNEAFAGEDVRFLKVTFSLAQVGEHYGEVGRLIAVRPRLVILMLAGPDSLSRPYGDPRRLPSLFDPSVAPLLRPEWGFRQWWRLRREVAWAGLNRASTAFRYRVLLRRRALGKAKPLPSSIGAAGWFWQWPRESRAPLLAYNKRFFSAYVERLRRAGVRVVVVDDLHAPLPTRRGLWAAPVLEEYRAFLEGESRRLGFPLLRYDAFSFLRKEHFRDVRHMEPESAPVFTRFLAGEIRRHRWLEPLPE